MHRSKGAPVQKPGLAHGGHCRRAQALVRPQISLQGLGVLEEAVPAPPRTPTTHRSVLSLTACARHAKLRPATLQRQHARCSTCGEVKQNMATAWQLLSQTQGGLCPTAGASLSANVQCPPSTSLPGVPALLVLLLPAIFGGLSSCRAAGLAPARGAALSRLTIVGLYSFGGSWAAILCCHARGQFVCAEL